METIAELGELRLIRQGATGPVRRVVVDSPAAAAEVLRPHADRAVAEMFWILALDVNKAVIGGEPLPLGMGTLETVAVGVGEIVRAAAVARAHSIILAHCHPGQSGRGQPEPSDADVHTTRALVQVCAVAGIPVLDHIIFGEDGYTSLADRGVIDEATEGPHPVSDLLQRGFTEFDKLMADLHARNGVDPTDILYRLSQKYAGQRARRDKEE